MRVRGLVQLLSARVGQHGVSHTRVALAPPLLDEAGPLETVEEPRHARRRQDELLGEVDSTHRGILGVAVVEQRLEVVDGQAVLGEELSTQLASRGRMRPQQAHPGRKYLCGQYLTAHVLSVSLLLAQVYLNDRRSPR